MNHRWAVLLFAVLVPLSLICCKSYTRSLTRDREVTPHFLSTVFEPGKTYKVRLKNREEFKIEVTSITQDSLYGTFHFMAGNRMRKAESHVLLDDIVEVKEKKLDIIKTVAVIFVPVVVVAIIVTNITFSGMTF